MHECDICGHTFEIEQSKEGTDYGHRYCPSCGTLYDLITIEEPQKPS